MTRKVWNPLETLEGRGKLFDKKKTSFDVFYSIEIKQQLLSGKIEGLQNITGNVSIISDDKHIELGETVTLQLKDGRTWECWAKSGDPINGTYTLVNSSPDGLI